MNKLFTTLIIALLTGCSSTNPMHKAGVYPDDIYQDSTNTRSAMPDYKDSTDSFKVISSDKVGSVRYTIIEEANGTIIVKGPLGELTYNPEMDETNEVDHKPVSKTSRQILLPSNDKYIEFITEGERLADELEKFQKRLESFK